jgi:archaellum component FlaG (FlaF/FlaG flagellin family)
MRTTFAALALLTVAGCGGTEDSSSSSPKAAVMAEQTAAVKGAEITLTSVEETAQIGDEGILPPAGEGETYIVAHFSVKNTGDKPLAFTGEPTLNLVDGNGQTYEQDVVTSAFVASSADPSGFASGINPGTSKKSGAVWKVAKKAYDPAAWKLVTHAKPKHEFKLN